MSKLLKRNGSERLAKPLRAARWAAETCATPAL
jgi:hypothetical protein